MTSINFPQWGMGLLVGIGGVVLIAVFLLAVLAPLSLVNWIPWILAFNCAHGGFYWISKSAPKGAPSSLIWAFALGLGISWVCLGILAGGFRIMVDDAVFSPLQVGLFGLIGGGCAQAGAWLAARAAALNRYEK